MTSGLPTIASAAGAPSRTSAGPPPDTLDGCALFLDVDGSLLDLQPLPDAVYAPSAVLRLLRRLSERLDGALAILSGRALSDLDRIFFPLRLPGAGIHGLERRDSDGRVHRALVERGPLERARPELERFARAHAGALVEDKALALAVHTRRVPAATHAALALVEQLAAGSGGLYRALAGHHVAELRPAGADKGAALAAFMVERGFADRRPLVVGDDVTDADAFNAARARGGVAIAVGPGAPEADHWLDSPAACRAWLTRAVGAGGQARRR